MRPQISFLTQSRFYSPAFNAAIFDGPLRIYFAQFQEQQALKIYFAAQQRLQELYSRIRENFRRTGVNIFVMLYPSTEAFEMSFDDANNLDQNFDSKFDPKFDPKFDAVRVDRLGIDYVIGVKGPISDGDVDRIYARVEEIARLLASESELIGSGELAPTL